MQAVFLSSHSAISMGYSIMKRSFGGAAGGGANMRAAGQRASVNVVCEVAGVDFWLDEIFAGIFP